MPKTRSKFVLYVYAPEVLHAAVLFLDAVTMSVRPNPVTSLVSFPIGDAVCFEENRCNSSIDGKVYFLWDVPCLRSHRGSIQLGQHETKEFGGDFYI